MNLQLEKNYFLATGKFKVDREKFLNNSFYLYINNIDDINKLSDMCWDESCAQN